jgi:hypothetical protein
MERDLQQLLAQRIESVVHNAGCPKCTILLFTNEITVKGRNAARATLMAAGDGIESLLRTARIEGAQVTVQPGQGLIHIRFASMRSLDRMLKRAIDQGTL